MLMILKVTKHLMVFKQSDSVADPDLEIRRGGGGDGVPGHPGP